MIITGCSIYTNKSHNFKKLIQIFVTSHFRTLLLLPLLSTQDKGDSHLESDKFVSFVGPVSATQSKNSLTLNEQG